MPFAEHIKTDRGGAEAQELIEQAYIKAVGILEQEAINMDDPEFSRMYGADKVAADKRYVAEKEEQFKARENENTRQQKKIATILEALFYEQSRANGWLGANAHVLRSSTFDDIANGVDCITEYKEQGRSAYLAMAIDATSSSHTGGKFARIREDLTRNKLGKIKYLKTADPRERENVPRVVVGVSPETLREVMGLWLNGDAEALGEHPIQTLMLEEIVLQLQGFSKFSEDRGHTKNLAIFERYLGILEPILEEKQKTIPADALHKDIVFNNIKAELVGLTHRPAPVAR